MEYYGNVYVNKEEAIVRVNIDKLVYERGLSMRGLSKQVGCSYSNLCKLCKNETSSIRFDILERLCNTLECGVEELLVIENTCKN